MRSSVRRRFVWDAEAECVIEVKHMDTVFKVPFIAPPDGGAPRFCMNGLIGMYHRRLVPTRSSRAKMRGALPVYPCLWR